MYVTAQDFDLLPYSIPNLQQQVNTFQPYVDKAETAILKQLLGVTLYNDFIAGLDALPPEWMPSPIVYALGDQVVFGVSVWESLVNDNQSEPAENSFWTKIEDSKWLKLEKGWTFTYQDSCCHADHSTEWLGLHDMLIPYIFFKWLRDTFDTHTGLGIVQAKAENSLVTEPKRRLVDAYNDYVDRARVMFQFIYTETFNDPLVYNTCNCCLNEVAYINTFGI